MLADILGNTNQAIMTATFQQLCSQHPIQVCKCVAETLRGVSPSTSGRGLLDSSVLRRQAVKERGANVTYVRYVTRPSCS